MQLATLESSLHSAVLNLTDLIDQATGPDHSHALTMVALRLQQPEVCFLYCLPVILRCACATPYLLKLTALIQQPGHHVVAIFFPL